MSASLTLPWAPSVNDYWKIRMAGKPPKQFPVVYVGVRGEQFRREVKSIVRNKYPTLRALDCRIKVELRVCPARNGKCDLDNFAKCALDALTKAGVWVDDSQIDRLEITRGPVSPPGRLEVTISEIRQAQKGLFSDG